MSKMDLKMKVFYIIYCGNDPIGTWLYSKGTVIEYGSVIQNGSPFLFRFGLSVKGRSWCLFGSTSRFDVVLMKHVVLYFRSFRGQDFWSAGWFISWGWVHWKTWTLLRGRFYVRIYFRMCCDRWIQKKREKCRFIGFV